MTVSEPIFRNLVKINKASTDKTGAFCPICGHWYRNDHKDTKWFPIVKDDDTFEEITKSCKMCHDSMAYKMDDVIRLLGTNNILW